MEIIRFEAFVGKSCGELRLLYASAPMAIVVEQMGGAGSMGAGQILDVLPDIEGGIHVRVPMFLRIPENAFELDQSHRYCGNEERSRRKDQ